MPKTKAVSIIRSKQLRSKMAIYVVFLKCRNLLLANRKQWVLFPPEDSICLYPTRIPYEESSVFSQVDVLKPDLERFPLFQVLDDVLAC